MEHWHHVHWYTIIDYFSKCWACKCLNVAQVTFSQLSNRARDSEYVMTMNEQEYVHFEAEFGLNQPYVPIEEDILDRPSASKVCEIIEDDLWMSEMGVPNVQFSQVYWALETLSTFLEQQQSMLVNLEQSGCLQKNPSLFSIFKNLIKQQQIPNLVT